MGELVLICGRDVGLRPGGAESYAIAHARAATLAGYRPHIFVIAKHTETVDHAFAVLHRRRTPLPGRQRAIYSMLHRRWLVAGIVELLRDRPGPHVLHGFGPWSYSAVVASRELARLGVGATAVTTIFTPMEHEASAKLGGGMVRRNVRLSLVHRAELVWARHVSAAFERRTLRASRVVVVNYESVRVLLEQAHGPDLPISRLTYCAATAFEDAPDLTTPEPIARLGNPSAPLVVAVGRHDGRKGLDVLIRALAGLRDAGIPFRACLVGSGALYAAHRQLVARLGLGDQVALPGRVARVMPYLHTCDVFVLPSLQEGSGSVAVLEAMQAGAAIVSTDVDGMPEDLVHGRDALLVPPGDVPAMTSALMTMLDDPALRARLGAAAREVFERRFAPQRAAQDLGALYAGLGLGPAA